MGRYISKRVLTGILTIVIVLVFNFVLIRLAPGDPARILVGIENPSEELVLKMQEKYGLDKPMHIQLIVYAKNLLKGDLGHSIVYDTPVWDLIKDRMGPSLLLALSGAITALIIGTALGIYGAMKNGSKIDTALSFITYIFYSMPSFWLGLMLILIFASWLKIVPTAGMTNLRNPTEGWAHTLDVMRHMILPAGTLALVQIPVYFRIARSSVMQILSEEFITTFRATGMKESKIFRKYVFKNAVLPTITIFGIRMAYIVTGAALVEIVFAWPGMGRLMLGAIMRRDYPLLMGIYLMLSLSVAFAMVVTDIVYAYVDPRIRYQ